MSSTATAPSSGRAIDRIADRALGRIGLTRDGVAMTIYGEKPLDPDGGRWRARIVLPILFVAGTVIGIVRVPRHSLGVLWAEDGHIFLQAAISPNWAAAIVTPYAGYLHVVPRLIAALFVAVLPLSDVAYAFTFVSIAITAALGCFVYQLSRSRIRLKWVSLVLWVVWVTLSVTQGEVLADLTNLHWYMTSALVWAVLMRHRTRAMRVVALMVIVFAILSDGLSFVVIPLVFLRYLFLPEPGRRRFALVVACAYAVQLVAIILAPWVGVGQRGNDFNGPLSPVYLAEQFVDRIVMGGTLGIQITLFFNGRLSWFWIIPAILLLALIVAVALRSRSRVIALIMLAYGILFFLAPWLDWVGGGHTFVNLDFVGRYSIIPIMLMVAFLAFTVDSWLASTGRVPVVVATMGIWSLLLVSVFFLDFQVWKDRAETPGFAQSLQAAAARCRDDPQLTTVQLAVAPNGRYDITMPCKQAIRSVKDRL